jgi:hypothetical protein
MAGGCRLKNRWRLPTEKMAGGCRLKMSDGVLMAYGGLTSLSGGFGRAILPYIRAHQASKKVRYARGVVGR